MKRREFLSYLAALGLTMTCGTTSALGFGLPKCRDGELPSGMFIIDAHAHPDQLYDLDGTITDDETSTLEKINQLKMVASSFAAVGDFRSGPVSFSNVMKQLTYVMDLRVRVK